MKSHRLVVIATAALWLLSCANAETIVLSGEFTMTDENKMPNAKLTGTFYYKYDTYKPMNSRLRFDYKADEIGTNSPKIVEVSELYKYDTKGMYSMCSDSCTAKTIGQEPDMWWYQKSDEFVQKVGLYTL